MPRTLTRTRPLRTVQRALWWIADYGYAAWRQAASVAPTVRHTAATTAPRESSAAAVIVLPGVYERWGFLRPTVRRLAGWGHEVHVVAALGWNTRSIESSAALVARYCAHHQLNTVAIVAHSKGGLIAKQVMLQHEATVHVSALYAIATPFAGSKYARLLPTKSLREFASTHPRLTWLTRGTAVNERITSVYPSFDPHIPERSELPGAHNHEVPTGGHFRVLAHPRTLWLLRQWSAQLTAQHGEHGEHTQRVPQA